MHQCVTSDKQCVTKLIKEENKHLKVYDGKFSKAVTWLVAKWPVQYLGYPMTNDKFLISANLILKNVCHLMKTHQTSRK